MGRWWVQETNTNEGTKARQQQTSKFRAGRSFEVKTSGLTGRECLITNPTRINDNDQFAPIPLLLPHKIQPALTHYKAICATGKQSREQKT